MAAKNKYLAETADAKQAVEAGVPKVPVADKKGPERYMYVGPTVPGIGIQNRVYTGIPQEVEDIVDGGNPVIGDLFIKIRDYPKAERMLREQKGYLYNAYLAAEKIRVENAKKAANTFTGGGDTEERGGVMPGGKRAWHIYIRRGYGPYHTKRVKRGAAGGYRDCPGKYGGRPGIRG